MLFNRFPAYALYSLLILAVASAAARPATSGHDLSVRAAGGWSWTDFAPSSGLLAVRSKRKKVRAAKCTARVFTKDEVGAAYAKAKAALPRMGSMRGFPKHFGNNLHFNKAKGTCEGTPVFSGLMNNLIEFPINNSLVYRVVLKRNGNFVGVMEHAGNPGANDFKACTLLSEEAKRTAKTPEVAIDDTVETTCNEKAARS